MFAGSGPNLIDGKIRKNMYDLKNFLWTELMIEMINKSILFVYLTVKNQ